MNLAEPVTARHGPEPPQQLVFYPASQDAAAQQQSIDSESVTAFLEDHESGQAVVAETVADGHGMAVEPARSQQRLKLGFRSPNRSEVELVGSLGQLRCAHERGRGERANVQS